MYPKKDQSLLDKKKVNICQKKKVIICQKKLIFVNMFGKINLTLTKTSRDIRLTNLDKESDKDQQRCKVK